MDRTKPEPEPEQLTCEEQLEARDNEILELKQALRKEIHFRTASEFRGEVEIWLYVVDALNLRMAIRKQAEPSIDKDRPYDKLIFTVDGNGRVTDVKGPYPQEISS